MNRSLALLDMCKQLQIIEFSAQGLLRAHLLAHKISLGQALCVSQAIKGCFFTVTFRIFNVKEDKFLGTCVCVCVLEIQN